MSTYTMRKTKKNIRKAVSYLFLIALGFLFIYPLLFLASASFKSNAEMMTSSSLIPKSFSFESYVKGWVGVGKYTFGTYLWNSVLIVFPVVVLTIVSCAIVGYGFARFKFTGHGILFGAMLSTLMLPNAVLIIPKYLLFRQFGWLDTYTVFYMPALFACYPFFIFSMVQFIRGIPKSLDESAYMDGCTTWRVFVSIILPLSKPCLFSMGIFQFIWTWNDYFNPLIYINSVSKYNVMQGLRLSMDSSSGISWGPIMAMSLVSIIPCIIVFFAAQKYFVEGIATTGLKG